MPTITTLNSKKLKLFFGILFILCFTNYTAAQVTLFESNLPIVVLNTNGAEIVDEPRIVAQMGIINNDEGEINHINDDFTDYSGRIAIEIRGSSSQFFPKKQFGLETQNEDGSNNNVSLLGMPEENDWILYAPFSDKSLIRNVMTYKMARSSDNYAPRTRLCEVVINGEYQGVYVLMEKIKRDKNRVDISKLKPEDIEGDELTGGYMLKIDKQTGSGGTGWASPYPPMEGAWQTTLFQYEYPDFDEIQPEQAAYIESYVTDFENALWNDDFSDSTAIPQYRQYIDMLSFIDFFLLNELTKNVDGYRLSTFMYKTKDSSDDGGKLHMGPVWDFNLAFGNADYCEGGNVTGYAMDFNTFCPDDGWIIHFWWQKLLRDPVFAVATKERWDELRAGIWSDMQINTCIDSLALVLDKAQERNFTQWDILQEYVWPNNYVGNNYENEIGYLKSWIEQRTDWLDDKINQLGTAKFYLPSYLQMNLSPNPFQNELLVTYEADRGNAVEIYLYDISGKRVAAFTGRPEVSDVFQIRLN
ncbi:MAG: CotH kinase family protein, partial [Chitinophagales bacterium]